MEKKKLIEELNLSKCSDVTLKVEKEEDFLEPGTPRKKTLFQCQPENRFGRRREFCCSQFCVVREKKVFWDLMDFCLEVVGAYVCS